MIIGRLSVSYDRGVAKNHAEDLGLDRVPSATAAGQTLRGLGTHWRDESAKDHAQACAIEERQIRASFREAFISAPIPGTFVLPTREAARELLASIVQTGRVHARCAVYDLTPDGQLPAAELADWESRIRRQLEGARLGRGKQAKAGGLTALEQLAGCPILADETREQLAELVAAAKLGTLERVEFTRRLALLPVSVDLASSPAVAPRRVRPAAAPESSENSPEPEPAAA